MEFGLHGLLVRYSNVITDIMIAAEAGYDSVELHTDKLDRYLGSGLTSKAVNEALERHATRVSCIGIIGCGVIQVNAFCELEHLSETENIKLTARNIRKICKIGAEHGVAFQYEGAAWTPIRSLRQCTDLISEVAMDNFRLVLDYWHFWAGREWTQAVRATRYNGSFSAEILGDTLWESNLRGIAVQALRRMKVLVPEHS